MKKFTREEFFATIIIFLVLLAISVPNFIAAFRRSRDQMRRDDMGALQHALDGYLASYKVFPFSTPDGKIIACKRPEDKVEVDKSDRLMTPLVPCEWGKDSLMGMLGGDPHVTRGVQYIYLSDGSRYQFFAALEGRNEPEFDAKIVARNLNCGVNVCNMGRAYACDVYKTLQQCEEEAKK